jgi:hypothetical protein
MNQDIELQMVGAKLAASAESKIPNREEGRPL